MNSQNPAAEWRWFGHAGHFICAQWCRFHLCTQVGDYLVTTVGEYVPDEQVREILAKCRGVTLSGKGDARLTDWMEKCGFEDIGLDRTYETMVFAYDGVCEVEDCGCDLPVIIPTELDFGGYNMAGDASKGHYAMCEKWAKADSQGAAK